jgi:hypothetical protein
MALNRPFTYTAQVVVASTSVNTASVIVGVGQTLDVYEVFVDNVAATLFVVGLHDSTGLQYSNAAIANPIPMAQLISAAKVNPKNIFEFPKPINLVGQIILLIDVQNTAGVGATVNFAVKGFLTIAGAT